MAENIQVSKKTAIFLLAGVLLMAFLGVLAGSYFVRLKSEKANHTKAGANLLLKVGQIFPNHVFNTLDGQTADLYQLLNGKKAVIIFLSTECAPCKQVTEKWSVSYPQASSNYIVLGISGEPASSLKEYQVRRNLTFPLYCDSLWKFMDQYKLDVYPTLFGLNEKKEIVFIEFGDRQNQKVEKYLQRL